jgi:hypothetical protein
LLLRVFAGFALGGVGSIDKSNDNESNNDRRDEDYFDDPELELKAGSVGSGRWRDWRAGDSNSNRNMLSNLTLTKFEVNCH